MPDAETATEFRSSTDSNEVGLHLQFIYKTPLDQTDYDRRNQYDWTNQPTQTSRQALLTSHSIHGHTGGVSEMARAKKCREIYGYH